MADRMSGCWCLRSPGKCAVRGSGGFAGVEGHAVKGAPDGDINGDGDVGVRDFAIFAAGFGARD